MYSTIRPCLGANYFSFLQTRQFWKGATNSSHQNLNLGYLLTPAQRSGGLKCARLSAPLQGPTISFSFKLGIFVKGRPVALTRS